jgi:hypothetical protein
MRTQLLPTSPNYYLYLLLSVTYVWGAVFPTFPHMSPKMVDLWGDVGRLFPHIYVVDNTSVDPKCGVWGDLPCA